MRSICSSDDIAGFVVVRTNDIEFCTLAFEVVFMRHGDMKLKA